jgi:hypothetical protein
MYVWMIVMHFAAAFPLVVGEVTTQNIEMFWWME